MTKSKKGLKVKGQEASTVTTSTDTLKKKSVSDKEVQ